MRRKDEREQDEEGNGDRAAVSAPVEEEGRPEDFERIFAQLASFRSRADALPEGSEEERRACAEQVATSFLRAMGVEGEEGERTAVGGGSVRTVNDWGRRNNRWHSK